MAVRQRGETDAEIEHAIGLQPLLRPCFVPANLSAYGKSLSIFLLTFILEIPIKDGFNGTL
jgi:hypothetical protein